MPTTIDLVLDREVPHHTPDQLHGLACAILEGPGVDHDADHKAFTVWPLRQERAGQVLRLTLLGDEDQRGRPIASSLRLGSRFFGVRDRRDEFVPFGTMANVRPRSRVALSFETPTYFSRNGRDVPLPDPVLVFQSLARKWNLHAPTELGLEDEAVRTLLGGIVVTDADIHTVSTDAAHRNHRLGFVGRVSFELTRETRPCSRPFAALAAAAEYLGVGAQTTRGFGVCLEGRHGS